MYSGEYNACDVTLSVYPHRFVGSIPTVARHIFQACPVWIYTQSNITSIMYFGFLGLQDDLMETMPHLMAVAEF